MEDKIQVTYGSVDGAAADEYAEDEANDWSYSEDFLNVTRHLANTPIYVVASYAKHLVIRIRRIKA